MEIKHLPISYGDRKTLKDIGERMFAAASVIFYKSPELADNLKILSEMAKSGTIQQDLVEMCKLKKIGIKRARLLVDAGIQTIGEWRVTDAEVIASVLHIKVKTAQGLKDLNQ